MTTLPTSNTDAAVLVAGPAWVGDMVLAQTLFMALHARPERPAVDVIAPPWSLPLLQRMPEVREAISLPVAHGELALRRRWQLGRRLRNRHYQQGIVLPRSAKAALPLRAAGIPLRTGFQGEFRSLLLNDLRDREQAAYRTVDRFLSLAFEPDSPLPDPPPVPHLETSDEGARDARLALDLPNDGSPVLALCPGAEFGPAKRWPADYYADIARRRLQAGWQVWLLGSDKDRDVCQTIRDRAQGARVLAGRTSLAQAIDLLGAADLVVSNDSGLMHIAAATGTPVVAIYGSSDPRYTPPMSPHSRVLSLNLECSPCFQRECPLGHLNCLNQLLPDRVHLAAEELLDQGRA